MAETSSGSITFAGLGSGTDFSALIEALIDAETQQRVTPLEEKQELYEEKITAIQELNTTILELNSALGSMDSMNEFLVKTSESSDEDILTPTADADAVEGNYSIEVNQLAATDVWFSDAFAVADSSTVPVIDADGATLDFDYAGTAGYSITLTANSTLDGVANAINKDANNPGIQASVIKVADNDFRLQISGMDQGANNQITNLAINNNTLFATGFAETQNAVNSQIKVNGFPAGATWIERDTNNITDAVPGVSLLLKNTGTTTVTVATDTDAIKENIQSFVESVNTVRAKIDEMTKFDPDAGRSSIFTGSYGIKMVDSQLKNLTATKGLGFSYDDSAYSVLSQIGIKTEASTGAVDYGNLVIDDDELDAALKADPTAVAKLFAASHTGETNSTDFVYSSSIKGITQAGEYTVDYTMAGGTATGTMTGSDGTVYTCTWDGTSNQLTGPSGSPVSGLAITVTNLVDGAYTGTVRVQQGKAGELSDLLDSMTNTTSGTLSIMEDGYNEMIDTLQDRLLYETERISDLEDRYTRRFSNLDATLATYNQQLSSVSSLYAGLGS